MAKPSKRIKKAGQGVLKAQWDAIMSPVTVASAQLNLVKTTAGAAVEILGSRAAELGREVRKEQIKVDAEARAEAAAERMTEASESAYEANEFEDRSDRRAQEREAQEQRIRLAQDQQERAQKSRRATRGRATRPPGTARTAAGFRG